MKGEELKSQNIEINESNYKNLAKLSHNRTKNINFIFSDDSPELNKIIPYIKKFLKIADKRGIKVSFNKYERLIGIVTDRLLVGPKIAQIDPTNYCNYNCIFCYCHSPLLKKKRPETWLKQQMSFEFFKKIIDELSRIGTEQIYLIGQGEALLHPKIMDMIKYIKKKKMKLRLTTSGPSFSKKMMEKFIDLGLDELAVNMSAATPETYVKVHPNQSKEVFRRLKESLIYLSKLKKEKKTGIPHINLMNIIMKINCQDLYEMVKLAKDVDADFITFRPINTYFRSGLESLLLTKEQTEWMLKQKKKLINYMRNHGIRSNFEERMENLEINGTRPSFYTEGLYKKIGCYSAWNFWMFMVNGIFSPCCHAPIKIDTKNEINIEKMWDSTEWKVFREKIKKMNSEKILAYDMCRRCENFEKNLALHEELKKHNLLQFLK
jgi:MoaA/NifB/PqqE/SkfB family radical SAM enzyme